MAKKKKKIITEERLREFQYSLKKNEKSDATIQKYMLALRRLMDYLGGEELSKEKMLNYRDSLKSHMKAQTVNGALSAIDSFLNYANWQDCKISFLKVQRQFFLNEARELSEDEYRRLLRTAKNKGDERLYMLMMTICCTGIRISELPYVTVSAVQFGRVEIELKRKCRTIIFRKELQKKLLGYIKKTGIKDGLVFRTRKGKALDRSNICRDMKKLCERANVNRMKVFPHNLRHLFAREFYAVEKNLSYLADVMGHSRIETTRIYVAMSADSHEKILNKMKLIC